ncbi:MAG: PAS domain S-box protein [Deltaproteobacteria bacterium]|nr:PAS domain S-box protein [Deltaproteobacteria bacterium]
MPFDDVRQGGGLKSPEKYGPANPTDATARPDAASRVLPRRLDGQELQRLLLSLLDNIPGMVYRGHPDWTLSFVGAEVERITGYPQEEASAAGFMWRRLIHPDDFEGVRESIRFAVRRRDPVLRMEYRIIRKDGETQWISDRRQLVYREDGRLDHVDGLVLDIMDQKKVETDLRAALEREERERARSEAIIAGIGDGISIQTPDLVITYQNGVLSKMIGKREGSRCHSLHGCLSREGIGCPVAATFADGKIHTTETEAITDRGLVQAEVTASPMKDARGNVTSVISIVRDITERKRAEEELRRLATAVEQAADAVIVTDPDWIIRYANPAFERIMGYRKDEVIGKSPSMFTGGDRDDRFFLGITSKAKEGEYWKGRLTNRRKDGTLLTGDTSISPVRDAEGRIVNYVIAKRDITREIVLEKQVQTAQRMEAVGTLAGGIAHDFNNALTGIIGFAELLRLRLPEDAKVRGDLDEILRCADRASTLTKQLLAFARRQVIEPVRLSLNSVVADLLRLIRKVSGEQIEVRTQLAEGIPSIVADRGQLEQVLMNLCLNSRDAMPKGGRFTVSTGVMTPSEDFLRRNPFMPSGRYVSLEVTDTGCGMDEVTRERAFDPYFTTKTPDKGTGLGLSMVYGIVKQNRGFIFLESSPGEGATFRMFFPGVEAAPEESRERATPVVRGGDETILLAEDEEAIRNLAARYLRGQGYTVLPAADGEAAVELATDHPEISMAILDVMMPRMGGKDVLDAIHRIHPGLPALFTSGYSTDQIHDSFVLLPGIEFLPKPYSPASLAGRIRSVLDGKSRGTDPLPSAR